MKREKHVTASGGLKGYFINDSSNVKFVGWFDDFGWDDVSMIVWFGASGVYEYRGISRQRAVACALAPSVGIYLNRKIKPLAKEVVKLA